MPKQLQATHLANQRPDPIPLTQATIDKLKVDRDRYLKEQDEVLIRLQDARSKGDLSENGAYKYAKFELGKVRRELGRINHLLRYGVVTKSSGSGLVEFGSEVTLEANGKEIIFKIVSEHESNPMEKKISLQSPLGKDLAGKQVGDIIKFQAPAGEIRYTVISVK